MMEFPHNATCVLTATLISIEMTKGRPAFSDHIFKLHLQNMKIPETQILRFYLHLSCLIRLTHFLCVCVCFTESHLPPVFSVLSNSLIQPPKSSGNYLMEEVFPFLVSFLISNSQVQHREIGPRINFKIIMNSLHLTF